MEYKIELKITDPLTNRGIEVRGYIGWEAKAAILKALDEDFERPIKVAATEGEK